MPQGIRRLAAVALILGSGAAAQQPGTCRDLDANAPQHAVRAFDCIARLDADLAAAQARIARLETQLADLAALVAARNGAADLAPLGERIDALTLKLAHPSVPAFGPHPATRAVIAYTSDKGEKPCPDGWSPFEAARDRFILGVGAAHPDVGQTGGADAVTLGEDQMPAHRHAFDHARAYLHLKGIAGVQGDLAAGTGPAIQSPPEASQTAPSGGGLPVSLMPPWIALHYCVRT